MLKTTSVQIISIFLLILTSGCGSTTEPPPNVITPSDTSTPTLSVSATPTITATSTAIPTRTPYPTPTLVSRPTLASKGIVVFSILHTNDFHAHLTSQGSNENYVPGAARLAYFIKKYRAKVGAQNMLLLDAGDLIEGANEDRPSKGQSTLDFVNYVGYQAGVIGNHEFWYGAPRLFEILQAPSSFQFLSANIYRKEPDGSRCSQELLTSPYQIYDVGESDGPKVRVAVIGIANMVLGSDATCIVDSVKAIKSYYGRLKFEEHADVIVALSHNGYDKDLDIVQRLNKAGMPVDILIGGHSHTYMAEPTIIGNTYVVQAGDLGKRVGVFNLTFDRATHHLTVKWTPKDITAYTPEDPETVEFLSRILP